MKSLSEGWSRAGSKGCSDRLLHARPCGIFLGKTAHEKLGGAEVFSKGRSRKMATGKIAVLSGSDEDEPGPMTTPRSRQERMWATENASRRLDTDMQTFHEFLAKKALVFPNLFRIEPFIGLAQPIPLKSTERTRKPDRQHKGVSKPARIL